MLETWTKFAFSIPPPAEHYFQPDSAAEFFPKFLHPPQDLTKIQRRLGPIDHSVKLGIPGIQRRYYQVDFPQGSANTFQMKERPVGQYGNRYFCKTTDLFNHPAEFRI
jgi:hypothetical protein